jgi:peptide/nickel transport system permease protein
MITYLIRRTLILIPTLFAITIIVFTLMQAAPGDPMDLYLSPEVDTSQFAVLRERLGLDQPLHIQYGRWVAAFFTGEMGVSFNYGRPVWELLKPRIPPTILLMGLSLLFAYLLAIPIGTISAIKQYSLLDHGVTSFAFIGVSMPNFWLGLLLIYLFSVTLRWLPSFGMRSVIGGGGSVLDVARHLIMPVIVLGTAYLAGLTRYMRAQVLEIKNEEYVKTARSKGLSERWVIGKHMMKNSLIPIVTLFGLQLPALLGGAIITEQIFAWPGMGYFFIRGVQARDYPIVMAMLTISATMTLMGNFLADLAYGVLDPRIRYN